MGDYDLQGSLVYAFEVTLSLIGSWGATGGLVASEATPLVISASFPITPGYSATFGGLPEEGGTLLRPFF